VSVSLSRLYCTRGKKSALPWAIVLQQCEPILINFVAVFPLLFLLLFLFVLLFLGIFFAGLETPLPLPSEIRSSRSQEERDCTPWGHSYVMFPTGVAYLTPRASPPRSFPGMLISLGHGPGNCCSRGCVPRVPLSCFDHQTMAPLCFRHRHCNISARMI
jgi:hypothetical protein